MRYKRLTKRRITKDNVVLIRNERNDIIMSQDAWDMFANAYNRLAELEDKIEQGTLKEEKTCTNISEMHPVDGFTCSECGITIVDYVEEEFDEENYDTTYREYAFKYCPNCGAKVVE